VLQLKQSKISPCLPVFYRLYTSISEPVSNPNRLQVLHKNLPFLRFCRHLKHPCSKSKKTSL